MRVLKLLAISLLTAGSLQASVKADDDKGIYLDAYMERVSNKKSAAYYCELESQTEAGYHYKVYYMTGELKMDGWYEDAEMLLAQGTFTYYYKSGQVECTGEYLENVKFGLWERYSEDGTEKPEKLYASLQMMEALAAHKEK